MSRLHLFHRKKVSASSSWEPSSLVVPDGRRYLKEQPYVLPKDHQETERIKFQHWMLYAHLHRHSFAPILPTSVRRILDVGCGSGAWLTDIAALFPNATLTGLDSDAEQIALANTLRHPHCQFLQGDVLGISLFWARSGSGGTIGNLALQFRLLWGHNRGWGDQFFLLQSRGEYGLVQ